MIVTYLGWSIMREFIFWADEISKCHSLLKNLLGQNITTFHHYQYCIEVKGNIYLIYEHAHR